MKDTELKKKRVGIIRLRSLGDLVLIMAAVDFLKENDYQVDLYCRPQFGELFLNDPRFSNIFPLEGGFSSVLKGIFQIRKRHYNLFLDLQNIPESWFITFFSGAKVKKTTKIPRFKRFLLLKGINLFSRPPYFFKEHLKTANFKKKHHKGPSLITGKKVNHLIKPLENHKKIIAFAPGSIWENKKYPYFPELCALIAEKYKDIGAMFLGSSDESEYIEKIRSFWPGPSVNLAGKTALSDLAPLLSHCFLTITNDSAIMHISQGAKTPVLAFFGPTVREFGFAPWDKNSIILELPLLCRPCHRHGGNICKRGDRACLNLIKPERVLDIVERYI